MTNLLVNVIIESSGNLVYPSTFLIEAAPTVEDGKLLAVYMVADVFHIDYYNFDSSWTERGFKTPDALFTIADYHVIDDLQLATFKMMNIPSKAKDCQATLDAFAPSIEIYL